MTIEYKADAEDARSQSEYSTAGRYYTLAAYDSLSKCDFPDPESVTTGNYIGLAIYCFQNAAFTFRLANNDERCENHVEQAILVIEDFEQYTFRYDALRGLAWESIADLEQIRGNNIAAERMYDKASEQYREVTQTNWLAESIFEWSFEFFREIMTAAGNPITVEEQGTLLNSFSDRIVTKRERLPKGIETVVKTRNYSAKTE